MAGMISGEPWYRTVFAVDARALARGGITEGDCDPLIDRGDGVAALIRPADRVPKTVLLRSVVPGLSGLTDEHNRRHPEDRLRSGRSCTRGEVHHDPHSTYGPLTYTAFSTRRNPSTWDEGWLHVPVRRTTPTSTPAWRTGRP